MKLSSYYVVLCSKDSRSICLVASRGVIVNRVCANNYRLLNSSPSVVGVFILRCYRVVESPSQCRLVALEVSIPVDYRRGKAPPFASLTKGGSEQLLIEPPLSPIVGRASRALASKFIFIIWPRGPAARIKKGRNTRGGSLPLSGAQMADSLENESVDSRSALTSGFPKGRKRKHSIDLNTVFLILSTGNMRKRKIVELCLWKLYLEIGEN